MSDDLAYTVRQADTMVRRQLRRYAPRHEQWRRLEHLFRSGRTDGIEAHDAAEVVPELTMDGVNYTLPAAQMILAQMVGEEPEIHVDAWEGGEEAERSALQAERLCRYLFERVGAMDKIRDAAQDCVVTGSGFIKVGWAHEEEEVERDEIEIEQDLVEALEHDRRLADLSDDEPLDPDEIAEMVPLTEQRVVADEPWVEYVSPWDMIVPHDARRLEEARWVAQRVRVPYDEVMANPTFKDDVKERLSTATQGAAGHEDYSMHREERGEAAEVGGGATNEDGVDALAEVVLIEFYDMRSKRMMIFQLGADEPLYEGDLPYSHRHPPFVHLRMNNDGGARFWPFGALENIAPIQMQVNDVIADWLDNLRRGGNKYAVDEGALTTEAREGFESNDSERIVPLQTGGVPVSDVVQPLPRQGVPPDQYQSRDDLINAIHDQLALNDFQVGGVGADRMSGTAAAVVDGQATLRAARARKTVEQAVEQTGLLIVLLAQEFMEPDRIVRVSTPDGVEAVPVSRRDIQGEYRVKVDAGSTESVNPSAREQRALEQLQAVVPIFAEQGLDVQPILREIIRDLGHDPDSVMRPAEQPAMPAEAGEDGGQQPMPAEEPEPTASEEMEALGGPPMPAQGGGDVAL